MSRIASLSLAIAALILTSALGARAQMPDFQPVDLTEARAAQAISAMPEIFELAQRYETSAPRGGGDDMLGGLSGLATYAAARAELDGLVGAYGFSGYEDWSATIRTVMHAYAWVQSAGAMQQIAPAMDMAIQQIINNPNIPQAQKDAIIAQMGGGAMAGPGANAPSPHNQEIVRALSPEIEKMIAFMRTVDR